MHHKTGEIMFTALKYHAVDYLYEDKNYYHDGSFADDKYRRPWMRASVDPNQLLMNFSVLDCWKQCHYIEDFLEKKPISSTRFYIHNEDIEIVPSSNPCSQMDIDDAYLFMEDKEKCTHDNCLQADYTPVVLKGQGEDLYIEDELVFTDNLAQYAKQLPSLHVLLNRLSFFQVQDPLLNSKEENITEEDLFRKCFTFEMKVMPQAKEKEQYEDFCSVTLRDEETVILPIDLKSYKTTNLKLNAEVPTCLALKSLFEVTAEVVANENGNYKTDLRVKNTLDMEISEYCLIEEVYASQSRSVQECSKPANDTSFYLGELEIPLTPCRSEKIHMNSLYAELQSEPISPFSKSVLITESTKQYLEDLVWQSEKYHDPMSTFLFAEHQSFIPTCQHLPVTELKKMLLIQEDTAVFNSLEEDGWINLRESLALPCVLEAPSTDLENGKGLVLTNVETFPKIAPFQLEEWLKEKEVIVNHSAEFAVVSDSSETKDPFWSHIYSENVSFENNARKDSIQSETDQLVHFENQLEKKGDQMQPTNCQAVLVEPNRMPGDKRTASFEPPKKRTDDFDLLSSFIMLRSKHLTIQCDKTNDLVDIQVLDAKEESPLFANKESPVLNTTILSEKESKENEVVFIQIKASESQFQAYHILEATVAPVLKELTSLGTYNWRFATLNFDDTRFFLKQQEKAISDILKQGAMGPTDEKNIILFKHAAVLHLVVTVRDLLLTCSLNTAVGYLSKAKERYKDFVASSLDNLCRQLTIVHVACQKNLEPNPKTTELQHQMFNWMQSKTNEQNKVVIVTRMDDGDETAALISAISTVQGLQVAYLNSEKRGALLENKNIINRLKACSCVVVCDQYIGPDFPWTHFSLVVEYNYSKNSCWMNHCKNLNISYITFLTVLPETVGIALEEVFPDDFGHILLEVQIPYVFLTSEGLLNAPEILQLLEAKYNITFIERRCCEALQFFGNTDRYIVITIDECTAVVMQNVEELNYEKSSENVVLRLIVLSLQYTCCWIILYSKAKLNSEYSLAGNTLHHLALIYAALVPFSQKSEDFKVKALNWDWTNSWTTALQLLVATVSKKNLHLLRPSASEYQCQEAASREGTSLCALLLALQSNYQDHVRQDAGTDGPLVVLTSGIEETAHLVRQIADCVLMTSKRHPQEWLDKSWLSVLPSEAEKCLLTFPCINPLVAQLMLKKSLSMEWLLSSTFDQLQELLPEVPEKVLKHFSDITSLYTFNPSTEPKCQNGIVKCQEMLKSDVGTCSPEHVFSCVHGHNPFTENSGFLNEVQNSRTCSPAYYKKESCICLKPNGRHSVMAPLVTHQREMCPFEEMDHSRRAKRQQYFPFLKNMEVERGVHSSFCSFGTSTHNNLEAALPTWGYNQASKIYPEKCSSMGIYLSKVKMGQNLNVPVLLKNPHHQDTKSVLGMKKQSLMKQQKLSPASKHSWYLATTREDFPFQQNSGSFLGEFGGAAFNSTEFQPEEGFQDDHWSVQTVDSSLHDASFCKATSKSDRLFNVDFQISEEYTGRKKLNLLSSLNRREQDISGGLEFNQLPLLKKRRLTFEKDPGRSDGQTRLKFF